MKLPHQSKSRRSFLKKSAVATFGFTLLPSYLALGKNNSAGKLPPSQRLNLGCVGIGGRASVMIPGLCRQGHATPVAFCDVDFKAGRVHKNLDKFPGVRQFADFRVMLDTMGDDIDAVSVATPDHTHFVAAMAAMQHGKHVYVEKPLTHTFKESQLLMDAEKRYGLVTQMGNQGHTSSGQEQFKHLMKQGLIKDIVKIEAFKTPSLWFMSPDQRISQYPAEMPIPKSLDWDLWCGPAEMKPFNRLYHNFDWRGFYLYGCGMLGDWGAHIIDIAHDNLRLGLPTKIKALKMVDHNQVIFPLESKLSMLFPANADRPACELIWHEGENSVPTVDEKYWDPNNKGGKKAPNLREAGTILHRKDEQFLIARGSHAGPSSLLPRAVMLEHREDMKIPGPEFDHMESFTQACMGNGHTTSPFSISGELTQVLLLGVITQYLNEDLEFDPQTKRFKNNDKANALLDGPLPRKEWESFYRT
jgi:hypothetical protein